MDVILVRPGCTSYDLRGRVQGNVDLPLEPVGEEAARDMAAAIAAIQPAAVFHAPESCCRRTGEILAAASKCELLAAPRLRNWNLGLWQGQQLREMQRTHPKLVRQFQDHPERVQPPEGESLEEVVERAELALARIRRKVRRGPVVVIARDPMASVVERLLHDADRPISLCNAGAASWTRIVSARPVSAVR